MAYCSNPGLSRLWLICLLGCFTYVVAVPMVINSDGNYVTYKNKELLIKEFTFSCGTSWIIEGPDNNCNEKYTYVMLFNQEGKILEHTRKKDEDGTWTAETSLTAERKSVTTSSSTDDKVDLYHSFLFRLIWEGDSVKIMSSDRKVLTAAAEGEIALFDKDKPCPPNERSPALRDVDTDVLNLACESRGECPPMTNNVKGMPGTGTILAPECQEGRWKLVKKGIFLEIRNAKDESKRLKFSSQGTLTLDSSGELFTGMRTNFRTGYYLDKSNTTVPKPYDNIPDNAYGDVVMQFQDRNDQPQEAFLCDYLWDEADSSTICSEMNYTASMPTYNGAYSLQKEDFAVSGVECNRLDATNFTACPFKVGANDNEELQQKNMKAFKGKGYGCAMTNKHRDIGGVICGTVDQIAKLQQSETKCDRNLQKKGTPGQIFSLEEQVRKFSNKMSEQKHWSEFLLPIPLSVTLLASVILTSSNARPITLKQPIRGFEFLKYDSLEGNLIFVSNRISHSFDLSHTEMIAVKLEAENIHRSLGKVVKYAYKSQSKTNVKKVKKYLKKMAESADLQVKHVDKIIDSFDHTNNLLDELIEVMGETDSFTSDQRFRISQYIQINKEQNKKRNEKMEKLKKDYKAMEKKAKKAESKFFERTEQLLNQRCIDEGTTPCNKCEHRGNLIEKKDNGEGICDGDPIKICNDWVGVDGECLESIEECSSWAGIPNFALCLNWDTKCQKWKKKRECHNWNEHFCPSYKYKPAGHYCFDNTNLSTDQCGKCNHIELVLQDMETMTKFTSKMLKNVLNEQPQNNELVSFLTTNLERFSDLLTKLHDYQNQVQEASEQSESSNVSNAQNEEEESISISTEHPDSTSSESNTSQESTTGSDIPDDMDAKLRKKKNNVLSILSAIKPLLQTSEQLFMNKNKNEKKLKLYCRKVLHELNEISKGLKGPHTDVNEFIKKVQTFFEDGQIMQNDLVKMKANDAPKIEATGIKRLGQEFVSYQESLINRIRMDKDISSLSQRMEDSIEEILAKEFEGKGLDAVIVYLRETSKQLTYISKLWTELRQFFKFIAEVVKRTQTHSSNAREDFFDDTEDTIEETNAAIDDLKLDPDTLTELKESTVAAMAYNTYTYRIAKFYNVLMGGSGGGLLAKLKLVPNDRNKFREPNVDQAAYKRYKTLLKNEAKATQRKIKDDISREEQIIHNRLTTNIRNIENQFACALEDSVTEEDKKINLQLLSETRAVKNDATTKELIPAKKND